MGHQWTPEEVVEPPLALELIKEQFPELLVEKIRLLGVGWDNTAFVVDEDLIFRFPRREIALGLLEAEWCVLPKINSHLTVPVPFPKWRGVPTKKYPWPFIGYKMLPGYTGCYANLTDSERAALAIPLGKFLASLHSIPPSTIRGCQISGDNRSRIDGDILKEKTQLNFKELSLLGLLKDEQLLSDLLNKLGPYRKPVADTVVHGDFYVRHILVDDDHKLAGVIDWGDVHLGDPAIDLAIAHSFLPKEAHSAFKSAYGFISEETWMLAKTRSLYSSSLLVLFGHHSGDPIIMREGLKGLKMVAEA